VSSLGTCKREHTNRPIYTPSPLTEYIKRELFTNLKKKPKIDLLTYLVTRHLKKETVSSVSKRISFTGAVRSIYILFLKKKPFLFEVPWPRGLFIYT